MKAKTIKEVFVAMKWILENIGWTQEASFKSANDTPLYRYGSSYTFAPLFGGGPEEKLCSACISGAYQLVEANDDEMKISAWAELGKYVVHNDLVGWNDSRGRTKKEVIALLDEAINEN